MKILLSLFFLSIFQTFSWTHIQLTFFFNTIVLVLIFILYCYAVQTHFSDSQIYVSHCYLAMQVWNKITQGNSVKGPISHVFQTSSSLGITGVILQCSQWLAVWNEVCATGWFCTLLFWEMLFVGNFFPAAYLLQNSPKEMNRKR